MSHLHKICIYHLHQPLCLPRTTGISSDSCSKPSCTTLLEARIDSGLLRCKQSVRGGARSQVRVSSRTSNEAGFGRLGGAEINTHTVRCLSKCFDGKNIFVRIIRKPHQLVSSCSLAIKDMASTKELRKTSCLHPSKNEHQHYHPTM